MMREKKSTSKYGKKGVWAEAVRNRQLLYMLLPGFLLLILFRYVPLYGVSIAFKDFKMMDGITGSAWAGFEHFERLFSGGDFPRAFKNTVVISLLKLVLGFPVPIILAIMINETKFTALKKGVQTFSYLPHFFSWVTLSGIITMVFSTTGPVNTLISMLTGHTLEFFADGKLFIVLIITTAIWQSMGWSSILYLAAITGIDPSLYEAASLDGAGKFRQILNITLPCLVPTIVTVFILNLSSVLNAGFDQIYNLYNPTVYDVSDIIDTYVLRRLKEMDYSLGTAAGLLKSVICFALVLAANAFTNKISDNELGLW